MTDLSRPCSLLSPPAEEAFEFSEALRERWHRFRLTSHLFEDAALAAECALWAREPAPAAARYAAARAVCGCVGDDHIACAKPLALSAIAGAWPPESQGLALPLFYRAHVAVGLLEGNLSAKGCALSQQSAEATLRFFLAGADPAELNAPWPQLDGERLLPALFGSLSTGRWALPALADMGLDLLNEGRGPSAALLLIEEAAKRSNDAQSKPPAPASADDDDDDDDDDDISTLVSKAMAESSARANAASELQELLSASLRASPGAARSPLLDPIAGQPPALLEAFRHALEGRLPWSWVRALLEAGADLNALNCLGMGLAHFAFQAKASASDRAKAFALAIQRPDLNWAARSIFGRPPAHAYRQRGSAALPWWEACKDIEACWEGDAAAEAIELFADAWHPDSREDFHALIGWLDQNFPSWVAVRVFGAPAEGWTESAFERGASRWIAGLSEERRGLLREMAKELCPQAVELAAPAPEPEPKPAEDPRPTLELYSPESWAEFAAEYLGSPSETHAFAQKLHKRVKSQGEAHRVRRLAMAADLLAKMDELRADFPHFSEVIDHLEDHCHLQMAGDGSFYLPPMLLAGGPGVGKTFFFKRVSEHVATAYKTLQMESMTGSFVLTGMASSWSDSRPGVLYSALELGETANPIILLDEIDKASQEAKHRPDTALLPLLEPHSAQRFQDECVPLKMDARRVCWVATANELSLVSAPLQSRMDVFRVRAPNARERRALCSGVYRSILASGSWGARMAAELSEEVLDMAAQTQGPGATRDLRRAFTTACAKAVRAGRREIGPQDFPHARRPAPTLWDAALPEPGPRAA